MIGMCNLLVAGEKKTALPFVFLVLLMLTVLIVYATHHSAFVAWLILGQYVPTLEHHLD